jgi:hypothetical protein
MNCHLPVEGLVSRQDEVGPCELNGRMIIGARRRDRVDSAARRTGLDKGLQHKSLATLLTIVL